MSAQVAGSPVGQDAVRLDASAEDIYAAWRRGDEMALRAFERWARHEGERPDSPDGRSPNKTGKVRFRTPAELRRETPAEPPWVWEGYIARGWLAIFAGKPKVGKSTTLMGLVDAVAASANTFLDRPVHGGPVIVVTEEGNVSALEKLPDLDSLRVLTRDSAWPMPGWRELLSEAVAEAKRINAVLLVIDSFAFWGQLPPDAENDAGAVQRALAPVVEATINNLAVVLVHHQRKAGGEGGDALRGTGALAGTADMLIELERPGGDAPSGYRQLMAVGRWPRTPPMLLIDRNQAAGSWRVVGQGDARADAGQLAWQDRLLRVLPDGEPGLTFDELAESLQVDKRKWHGALSKLVGGGDVRVAGEGKKGSPKRFWKASANADPRFRPPVRTEKDDNASDELSPFPSVPRRGTETKASCNGAPPAIPSPLDADADADADAQAEAERWAGLA